MDLYKVDLKSFNDRHYRQLGGRLQPILDGMQRIHEMGFWLEVVTLIVPGFNDSDDELRQMAEFLVSISPDILWHVTAFHQDYKMTEPENTPPEALLRAARIGRQAGLHYVYAGNLPGRVGDLENTYAARCGARSIGRHGYRILDYNIDPEGRCRACLAPVPGRWAASCGGQMTDRPFVHLVGRSGGTQ